MPYQQPSYDTLCPAGEAIAAAGRALYGDNWKNRLAADLGVRERALQRWLPGHIAVPDGVWAELLALLEPRSIAIAEALERVRNAAARP